ncbi:hypothetical protein B0H11DRAFT_1857473 [Mycena galericulata]|nr:hypothetical protein B0H11DRAFT_1857473 [Mycena galericulata]
MPKSESKSPSKSPGKSPYRKSSSTPNNFGRYPTRGPITAINLGPVTTPDGPSIKRTEAKNKYKLKLSDLDKITPIFREPNYHGGGSQIQTYNECDVVKLALEVRPGKPLPEDIPFATLPFAGPASPSTTLAEKKGRRIMRTTACTRFNLTPRQLDSILPISAAPNVYGQTTKYYNLCDVEDLAKKLGKM